MNAISLNNLWVYLEGVLSYDDQNWLGNKLIESAQSIKKSTKVGNKKTYRISPRRKKLMEEVRIEPKDFENDERAQYILNR